MLILGIETSCDETSAAIVKDGAEILSNIVASQVSLHSRYGGIVPEVAARQHVLEIIPIVSNALDTAQVRLEDVDAIAVTNGPGLAGPLMVGVNFAKSLAYALKIPIIPINHLEGHTYAAWLQYENPAKDPGFPLVILIASGAHTHLFSMVGHLQYKILGQTLVSLEKRKDIIKMSNQDIDQKLLEILVCPLTKGPLEFDRDKQELISRQAKLAYPIRDGIPIMLVEEARELD